MYPSVSLVILIKIEELDRGNIANAITDDFMEDIGVTQNQFNVGQQMLSLGIVLFEIPSNVQSFAYPYAGRDNG